MKQKIIAFFNHCSTLFVLIMLFSTAIYYGINFNDSILGISTFLGLAMFLNPVRNLYCFHKKVIQNPIYHLIVTFFSIYVSRTSIVAIIEYMIGYEIDFGYQANLFFGERYIIFLIGIIFLLFFSLCFKKETNFLREDHTKWVFFVITITALLPILSDTLVLFSVLSIALGIFSFFMIFCYKNANTVAELQKLYAVMMILCLLTANSMALVLLITLYIQLDEVGIHI